MRDLIAQTRNTELGELRETHIGIPGLLVSRAPRNDKVALTRRARMVNAPAMRPARFIAGFRD